MPSGAQADYAHYNLYAQLYPNAYQNYKPPTGKAQFCESTFYLGNTYQQGEVTAYKQMVSQLAAAGHAQSNFIVENSNNSTATQLSQLQSEINSGCNVIFLNARLDDRLLLALLDRAPEEHRDCVARPGLLQQRHHGFVRRVPELV